MLYDTVDRESVGKMVREFYAVIIKDEIVGPYFTKKLGENLNTVKWHEHFETLDNFWLMLMTGQPGYKGNPFPPHAFIGKLYPETFARWLQLFNEVIRRLFVPEIADKFYQKAEILAENFMEHLGLYDEEEED